MIQESHQESLYFVIESRLYEIESINDSDIVLYGMIQSLSHNGANSCWATNKWLAERLRKDERSIQRSISRLKEAKLIICHQAKGKRYIISVYNQFYEQMKKNQSLGNTPKKELFDYDWLNEKEV